MVRKRKHKSTTKSQPCKVLHSSLVKIAEHVQLAHEAAGRTISAGHTQHLRRSINSGMSAALNEVQMSGSMESAQSIKQKFRDRILECIEGRSRYTTSRQVLVTLNNFIRPYKYRLLLLSNQRKTKTRKNNNCCDRRIGMHIVPGHRIARENGTTTRHSAAKLFLSSGDGISLCI